MRLTHSLALFGLASLCVFAPACVSPGPDVADIRVQTDVSPKVDLRGYKTYAWAAAGSAVNDPDGQWTLPDLDIGAEIVAATNRQLKAKGMVESSLLPDLLVIFGVGVDMKALELTGDGDLESLQEVPKGGILIVLADAESGLPVWAGAAEGKLRDNPSPQLAKKRIDYGIDQMFKHFRR